MKKIILLLLAISSLFISCGFMDSISLEGKEYEVTLLTQGNSPIDKAMYELTNDNPDFKMIFAFRKNEYSVYFYSKGKLTYSYIRTYTLEKNILTTGAVNGGDGNEREAFEITKKGKNLIWSVRSQPMLKLTLVKK